MEIVNVPLDTPFSRLRVELDGAEYVLDVEYNSRSGWYCGMASPDGEVLFLPRKLQVLVNLLRSTNSAKKPRGALVLDALEGYADEKPGLAALGRSHFLVYYPPEELV